MHLKTSLFLSILFLPSIILGQAVNHFENFDSKWYVAKTYPAATQQHPDFAATTTTIYGLKGDTLINSEQWFKVYSTNDSLFQNNLLYRGLLREDNNKVFYRDTLNQLDTLYDFSLNVGDSVSFKLGGIYSEWLQILEVDSVTINGKKYKRMKFSEPKYSAFDFLNEVWIEGIGSIHGPLFPSYPVKFSSEIPDSMFVICTHSNGQQVWHNQNYSNCYTKITLSTNKLTLNKFNVFPNPFTDKIKIQSSEFKQCNVSILNKLGQLIKQLQLNSHQQIIDLSLLKAGVYFLRVKDKHTVHTIKILKKQ